MNTTSDYTQDGLPILDEIGADLDQIFRAEAQPKRRRPSFAGRLRIRARLLVPLAIVLVGAGAAAAAVITTESAPPIHVSEGIVCPPGYNYIAAAQTHLAYPPDYPIYEGYGSLSRKVGGTNCYTSAQAASAAGYKLAPPPAGDVLVDGIYYGRPSSTVLDACRRARGKAGAPIYCPGLMPVPWTDPNGYTSTGADCPSSGCQAPLFSVGGAFVGPDSYADRGNGVGGNVAIWAMSTKQESEYIGQIGCTASTRVGSTTFRGHPAAWYACPNQEIQTVSSILEWQIGDEHYAVSVDGPPVARRHVVEFIASHLKRETPTS